MTEVSAPVTVVGNKIPFHAGLFFNAVEGLVGRKFDHKFNQGYDGYYSWYVVPKNEAEVDKFAEHALDIAKWLDLFDIIFSGSECRFGVDPAYPEKGELLIIRVLHAVPPRTRQAA